MLLPRQVSQRLQSLLRSGRLRRHRSLRLWSQRQDLRQLLYWHPLLQVDAASDYRIEFTAPGYAGRFKVVAEGFTEDGKPVYQTFTFDVE